MKASMKAVRLVEIGAPLEEWEVPKPTPEYGEVLVRIEAAGICHSDVHYRDGTAPPPSLPVTLGHEVAGTIESVGPGVATHKPGDRVCLHYMVSCRCCSYCIDGTEQFCDDALMIGKYRDGGFAEYIAIPAFNAVRVPGNVLFEWASVMMCSTSTANHAIRKARFVPGETAAVFGVGGLGLSAVQLLSALGAKAVYAIDIDEERLNLAKSFGAVPINALETDPVNVIHRGTGGVDVAVELLGKRLTIEQSLKSLARGGRAAIAGITNEHVSVDTYHDLVGRETELIGVSDHLRSELDALLDLADRRKLTYDDIVTERIPLDAGLINQTLDRLASFGSGVRTVILPVS